MRVPQSSESAEQFQLLDALPVLILLERAGKVVFANAAARQMIGHDDGLWTPRPVDDLLWGLSSGTAEPRTLLKGTQTGSPFHATLTANDGSLLPIEGTYSLLNGDLCDAIIVAHPGGRILAPSSRMMEDVLSSLPEAIVIVHGDRVLYTNPAFTRIFGYTADEAAGADLRALIVPDANAHEHKLLEMALDLDARSPIETVRHNKAGEEVHVAILSSPLLVDGAPVGCILTFRALGAKLPSLAGDAHEALHDPLTGLPNRALFRDRLSLALTRRTRRREQTCGVLLLVLEPMAGAEDAQQQAAGDALLVALAERHARGAAPAGLSRAAGCERVRDPGGKHSGPRRSGDRGLPPATRDGAAVRDFGRGDSSGLQHRRGHGAAAHTVPRCCCATRTRRCMRRSRRAATRPHLRPHHEDALHHRAGAGTRTAHRAGEAAVRVLVSAHLPAAERTAGSL